MPPNHAKWTVSVRCYASCKMAGKQQEKTYTIFPRHTTHGMSFGESDFFWLAGWVTYLTNLATGLLGWQYIMHNIIPYPSRSVTWHSTRLLVALAHGLLLTFIPNYYQMPLFLHVRYPFACLTAADPSVRPPVRLSESKCRIMSLQLMPTKCSKSGQTEDK